MHLRTGSVWEVCSIWTLQMTGSTGKQMYAPDVEDVDHLPAQNIGQSCQPSKIIGTPWHETPCMKLDCYSCALRHNLFPDVRRPKRSSFIMQRSHKWAKGCQRAAYRVSRHPCRINRVCGGWQVVAPVDRRVAGRERLEYRHPEIVPELAPITAWSVDIPLIECCAHAWVAPSLVAWRKECLDGSIPQLELCIWTGATEKRL